jgi:aminopeptidase N
MRLVRHADLPLDPRFIEAVRTLVRHSDADPAFAALTLTLPGEADIARDIGNNVDPDAFFTARKNLRQALSQALEADLLERYRHLAGPGDWTADAASAGRRALRNCLLDLACAGGTPAPFDLAERQFGAADNMTDRLAALATLTAAGAKQAPAALGAFHDRYRDDPLVIDKWLSVQALVPLPATLDNVRALMAHPSFAMSNPNRVRALIGAFASGNQTQFNRADGAGYVFTADRVLELDAKNPQVAARLLGAFKSWQALEPGRRTLAAAQLRRIADTKGLSRDVADIVNRALG